MATTMKDVRKALDPDEPNYEKARKLGAAALPFLKKLVTSEDPMLASKATYLAGLISTDGSAEILSLAANSSDPVLRVAAASAVGNLKQAEEASDILSGLMVDEDESICRIALTSLGPWATEQLQEQVKELSVVAPQAEIRKLAKRSLKQFSKSSGRARGGAKRKGK